MKTRHLWILAAAVVVAVLGWVAPVSAAQVMKGTLLSPEAAAGFLRINVDGAAMSIKPTPDARIMRGQIGKEVMDAQIADFAAGDHIVAVVDQYGHAASIKAFYGRIQGNFKRLDGNSLELDDGRKVPLSEDPEVVLPDGRTGKASDIRAGYLVVCRVNPVSGQAWTVICTAPSSAEPAPGRPEIRSITYSAPAPLKPGDTLTVDLSGTQGCKASFNVKGLIASTQMKETSPGVYRAVVSVPAGKPVKDAPLLGVLESAAGKAGPIQASRLITVGGEPTAPKPAAEKPAASEPQVPPISKPAQTQPAAPTPAPAETAPQPTAAPAVKPPPAAGTISIAMPADGARIKRSITIKGSAEPDARVHISITFNNGRTGLLKLAGNVASQLVSVDAAGTFKLGPIMLEGPLATPGLRFTIKVWYPDKADHSTARVVVIGDRV